MKILLYSFLFVLLIFPMSRSAQAHELKIFATAEGKEITGKVYFEGGGGVAGATITVLGPDGEVLREVITGPEGRFRFEARGRVDHRLHVRTIDLHEAKTLIKPTELVELEPASTNDPAPNAQIADLQAEIARLREELDQTKHVVRVRDILGGVGLILGLFSLLILWKRAVK